MTTIKMKILRIIVAGLTGETRAKVAEQVKNALSSLSQDLYCFDETCMVCANTDQDVRELVNQRMMSHEDQLILVVGEKGSLKNLYFPHSKFVEVPVSDESFLSIALFARVVPEKRENYFVKLLKSPIATWCSSTLKLIEEHVALPMVA